jgi:hypothetical protein
MEVIKTESYPQVTPNYNSECTIQKTTPNFIPRQGANFKAKKKQNKTKQNKDIEVNVE